MRFKMPLFDVYIGCAYADGCLTAEQVILTAYWRARIGAETKIAPGMMGAVGLTWEETERRCPPGVFPACHIAEKSVTVRLHKSGLINTSLASWRMTHPLPLGPQSRLNVWRIVFYSVITFI